MYVLCTSPSVIKVQREFLLEQQRWWLVLTHPHLSTGINTENSSPSFSIADPFSNLIGQSLLFAFFVGGYHSFSSYTNCPILIVNIDLLFSYHVALILTWFSLFTEFLLWVFLRQMVSLLKRKCRYSHDFRGQYYN